MQAEQLQTLFDRTLIVHQNGSTAAAESGYLEVLASSPRHAGALHLLGVIRQQQGRHLDALELIGQAIEISPAKTVYHNNYGTALLSLERFTEALESFQRALAIRPHYADALSNLGLAQINLAQKIDAESSFRRALQIEPVITELGGTPGSAEVVVNQTPAEPIIVSVAVGGSAVYGVDYTLSAPGASSFWYDSSSNTWDMIFDAGATSQELDVAPVVDPDASPDKSVIIYPAGGSGYGWATAYGSGLTDYGPVNGDSSTGTVTINDDLPQATIDDTSVVEGDTATFDVKLSKPVSYDVTFDYETEDGTAIDGTDYSGQSGEITIPAGATDSTDIAIPTLYDPNNTSSLKYSVNLSASSGVEVVKNEGSGIITAGTPNQSLPKLSISNVTVDAGDNAVFTATLSASVSYPVSFHYETRDGSAKSPADYSNTTGAMVFPAGQTTVTISIPTTFNANAAKTPIFELYLDQIKGAVATNGWTGPNSTTTYAFATINDAAGHWEAADTWTASDNTGSTDDGDVGEIAYMGHAKSVGGRASLSDLAYDITGNRDDWDQVLINGASPTDIIVPGSTTVDIAPLLKLLETRVRSGIVTAATSPKNAEFGATSSSTPNVFANYNESQINAVFGTGGPITTVACAGMVQLEWCEGLISQLKSGEFDKLGLKPIRFAGGPAESATNTYKLFLHSSLDEVQNGDWVNLQNMQGGPDWAWQEENTVVTQPAGDDTILFGWGGPDAGATLAGWQVILAGKYNSKYNPNPPILPAAVPGYSDNPDFMNLATIGLMIFNLREKNHQN